MFSLWPTLYRLPVAYLSKTGGGGGGGGGGLDSLKAKSKANEKCRGKEKKKDPLVNFLSVTYEYKAMLHLNG